MKKLTDEEFEKEINNDPNVYESQKRLGITQSCNLIECNECKNFYYKKQLMKNEYDVTLADICMLNYIEKIKLKRIKEILK